MLVVGGLATGNTLLQNWILIISLIVLYAAKEKIDPLPCFHSILITLNKEEKDTQTMSV